MDYITQIEQALETANNQALVTLVVQARSQAHVLNLACQLYDEVHRMRLVTSNDFEEEELRKQEDKALELKASCEYLLKKYRDAAVAYHNTKEGEKQNDRTSSCPTL